MAPTVSTLSSPAYCYDLPRDGSCGEPPVPVRAARSECGVSPSRRPLPPPPSPTGRAPGAPPPSTPLTAARPLRSSASETSLDTLSLRMAGLRRSTASGRGAAGGAGRSAIGVQLEDRQLSVVARLYGAAAAAAARWASASVGARGLGVAGGPPPSPPASRLVNALGLPMCVAGALPPLPSFSDFRAYFDARLRGADTERRLFQVLRGDAPKVPPSAVAAVVRALLAARGSPLYERNLRLAVETVLYGINADPLASGYTAAELGAARLAESLAAAENSGVLGGALAALAPNRFAGMLMDWTDLVEDASAGVDCSCPAAAAVALAAEAAERAAAAAAATKGIPSWSSSVSLPDEAPCADASGQQTSSAREVPPRGGSQADVYDEGDGGSSPPLCHSPPPLSTISSSCSADSNLSVPEPLVASPHTLACEVHGCGSSDAPPPDDDGDTWVCAGSLNAFCESKGLLTPRAVATVVRVYGRRGRLSSAGFCRLFQALTTCGSVGSTRYWFRVLDHDLDGRVGAGDVRHYFAHKRVLADPDVVLTCVRHVWTRLVAMSGSTDGLRMRDMRALTDKEREFVLCALLVRRVDDGGLVNVRATLLQTDPSGVALGVVS